MQHALRAGLQEIARGASTGLVVWSSSWCPDLRCDCPLIPNCNCGGTGLVRPADDNNFVWLFGILSLVALALFAVGFCVGFKVRGNIPAATPFRVSYAKWRASTARSTL